MAKRKFPKNNLSDAQLLEAASAFTFFQTGALPDDEYLSYFAVRVEWRSKDHYAVTSRGECWVGDKWDYEPQSSSRTDAFRKRAYLPLSEAVDIAVVLVEELRLNGSTIVEVRAHEASSRAEMERRDEEYRKASVREPLTEDAFFKTIWELHPSKKLLEDIEVIEANKTRTAK